MIILHQVHGDKIVDADEITNFELEPEADGAVTTKKNIVLSIQSADCVPILASSINGEIIGVAHSGWKGTRLGIIEKLIDKMKEKGAREIIAVIGPSIQQSSYEVDLEFYQNFVDFNQMNKKYFIHSKNHDHYMFDISGLVEYQLKTLGVNVVRRIMEDTYTNPSKYPSYRRSCHEGKPNKSDNIFSAIVIK